jgi:hypothetical protein
MKFIKEVFVCLSNKNCKANLGLKNVLQSLKVSEHAFNHTNQRHISIYQY